MLYAQRPRPAAGKHPTYSHVLKNSLHILRRRHRHEHPPAHRRHHRRGERVRLAGPAGALCISLHLQPRLSGHPGLRAAWSACCSSSSICSLTSCSTVADPRLRERGMRRNACSGFSQSPDGPARAWASSCSPALAGHLRPVGWPPNDPVQPTDILNKFDGPHLPSIPLGTDHLATCILSSMLYGIRPTLGLALADQRNAGHHRAGRPHGASTAGYFRGAVDGDHQCGRRGRHALLPQPDHRPRRGRPAGASTSSNVVHGQRLHQMGLVRPHDPHRVPCKYTGPELRAGFSRSIGTPEAVYILARHRAGPVHRRRTGRAGRRWMRAGPSSTSPPCPSSGLGVQAPDAGVGRHAQ